MVRIRCAMPIIALVCLSLPSMSQKMDQKPKPNNAEPERVTATVEEVQKGVFPEVELKLSTEGLGTWFARPLYKRSRGKVTDFADPDNVANFAAYYLLPGDMISLERSGQRRGITHTIWEVTRIKRLGEKSLTSPPVTTGKLEGSVAAGRASYRVGEPVRIAFRVANVSRETIELRFPSGQQYDFVIYRNEKPVWHWSKDRAFTMAFSTRKLKAGEELVFSEDWNQILDDSKEAEPGLYKVAASLTTSGPQRLEAWAIFEIR
jgi:hypothetical protein